MAYQTIRVTSVTEIIDLINGGHPFFASDTKGYCYRGQSNEEWRLIPSIFRDLDQEAQPHVLKKALDVEAEILTGFYNRFRGLNIYTELQSAWEYLSYSQHFGVPTRLLDWTRNPLVALYFAIENQSTTDAALWCLAEENAKYGFQSINQLGERPTFLHPFEKSQKSIEEIEAIRTEETPEIIVFQPPEFENRIRNQAGLFSVEWSSNYTGHFNMLIDQSTELDRKVDRLLKLQIPASAKPKMKRELQMLGIDAAFIYPDMEGISQLLKEQRISRYVEKEISMDREIRHLKDSFESQVKIQTDKHLAWQWLPERDYEFLLAIDDKDYAVYLVNLYQDIEIIKRFADFVEEIENLALQKDFLKGAYYVSFSALDSDWENIDIYEYKDKILDIIRHTKNTEVVNEEISISRRIYIEVWKTSFHSDQVRIGIYPTRVFTEPVSVSESFLSKIESKIAELMLTQDYPSILILAVFGYENHQVKDYTDSIRKVVKGFDAIFVITHFDKGFIVDNIFGNDDKQ